MRIRTLSCFGLCGVSMAFGVVFLIICIVVLWFVFGLSRLMRCPSLRDMCRPVCVGPVTLFLHKANVVWELSIFQSIKCSWSYPMFAAILVR